VGEGELWEPSLGGLQLFVCQPGGESWAPPGVGGLPPPQGLKSAPRQNLFTFRCLRPGHCPGLPAGNLTEEWKSPSTLSGYGENASWASRRTPCCGPLAPSRGAASPRKGREYSPDAERTSCRPPAIWKGGDTHTHGGFGYGKFLRTRFWDAGACVPGEPRLCQAVPRSRAGAGRLHLGESLRLRGSEPVFPKAAEFTPSKPSSRPKLTPRAVSVPLECFN